jgi:potassium uptake TrkH family protein
MSAPLSPARLLALSFGGMIATGTLLLMLPLSAAPGASIGPLDALFTATSAVCVTGLIVVDTSTAWSPLGHAVLLVLMQAGGLGYMTFSTLAAVALGRRVGIPTRSTLQEGLNLETREELLRFARIALRATLAIELAAALALAAWWMPEFGARRAAWLGLFHAVSAFNNAGFSTDAASLVPYAGQAGILLPVSLAVIIGGIGFPVLVELAGNWRRPSTWTILTRIVVIGTFALLTVSTLLVLVAEWDNPRTLGALPPGQSVLTAFVIAVMPRTAGFNAIDMAAQNSDTLFLTQILMLIGGGSAGTAGGIKVSTIGVLAFMVWAQARGEQDVNVARRRVPAESQRQAVMVLGLAAATVTIGSLIALHLTELPTEAVVFEVISAFSTVGLSLGITPELSSPVLWLLALLMFIGRTGPVTLAAAFLTQDRGHTYRLPEERTIVG